MQAPPHTATQLLPVRAFTCSVLVSTLLAVEVVDDGFVADDNDDVDEDNDEDEESERPFVVLSLLVLVVTLLLLPTFIIRVFTAACATDLKSASVGGFDKTAAAAAVAAGADDVVTWGTVATDALFFIAADVTAYVVEINNGADSIGSGFIATVLADTVTQGVGTKTPLGVICLTKSVFTGARAIVVAATEVVVEVDATMPLPLCDNVSGFGVLFPFFFLLDFLLVVPLDAVFLCFDTMTPTVLFCPMLTRRFGAGDGIAVVIFLFVPPGDATVGSVVVVAARAGTGTGAVAGATTIGCGGDITRSGERLVDETTLAALRAALGILLEGSVGSAAAATGSLLGSWSIKEKLLKDVEGRKAPNPSSMDPSFFSPSASSEGPNKDGISVTKYQIALHWEKCLLD